MSNKAFENGGYLVVNSLHGQGLSYFKGGTGVQGHPPQVGVILKRAALLPEVRAM